MVNAVRSQGGGAETELLRLVKERNELKAALLDFEEHMEDIQNKVKGLSSERDRFKALWRRVSRRTGTPAGWEASQLLLRTQCVSFSVPSGSRGPAAGRWSGRVS